jgi:molybdate transport system substrate-binding protein
VPAGQYAQESLQSLGLWERLRPRTVLAENVRQVLEYVARGEVEAGFVYATDVAAGGPRVRIAFRPGEDTYRPIVYPAAVIAATRHAGLGRELVEHLVTPEGQATLARHGFLPPLPGMR